MATFYETAYKEALNGIADGSDPTGANLPSYVVASDTHNIANKNLTFLESALETVENTPKFIGVSLISGINQIYNIPTDIGNFFGGDFERTETTDVIADLDSNLSEYYEENQESADLVGFIASSMVPGMAGIKILNAGQTALRGMAVGKMGRSQALAVGLLTPDRAVHLERARNAIINANSASIVTNRHALRAFGAGVGQAALEGIAFEAAVAATLFESPILENQTMGDLVSNVAHGAALFGVIGGVVDGVRGFSLLSKAQKVADKEAMPWRYIEDPAPSSNSYEKIAIYFEQVDNIPAVPKEFGTERVAFLEASAKTKVETLQGRVREEIGKLADGDQELASVLFQSFKKSDINDQLSAFIGLSEASRFAQVSKVERRLLKLETKVKSQKASVAEIEEFANTARSYTKAWGEDAGKVTHDIPAVTQLVDTLAAGKKLVVGIDGVRAGSRKYSFDFSYNIKPHSKNTREAWNILAADPLEVNARLIWASKLPKFRPTAKKPIRIHENDIPLLEKAMMELEPSQYPFMTIVRESGKLSRASSVDLPKFLKSQKDSLAVRLHNATEEGLIGSNPQVVLDKLRSMLALNIEAKALPEGTNAQYHAIVKGEKAGMSRIIVNEASLTRRPLHDLVSTILHEEGHGKFKVLNSLQDIPPEVKKEIIALSKLRRGAMWKHGEEAAAKGDSVYLDYLNTNDELMADAFSQLSQFPELMNTIAPNFKRVFGGVVRPIPKALVDSYAVRAQRLTQEEIAAMVNVKNSYLSGEQLVSPNGGAALSDIMALQSHATEYTKRLVAQGARKETDAVVDIWNVPQHMKLLYDTTPFESVNNHVIENMATLKGLQKLYVEGTDRASALVLGDWASQLPDVSTSMVLGSANRGGAGGGLATAASNNYGSLASIMEYVGSVTTRAIESFKTSTREALDPLLYKLAQNQEAAIEWSVLQSKIRNIEEIYGLNKAGDALIPLKILRWEKASEAAALAGKAAPKAPKMMQANTPLRVDLVSKEVRDLAKAHIELNGARTSSYSALRSAQGVQYKRDPNAFYPIPVDPKDYPHFAMVTDDSVTGVGHHKTLYATSAEDLQGQISKISRDNPHLTIRTKREAEMHFKREGQWDYEKTLNDNYLDVAAHRTGVSAPFLPSTDAGKITSDMLNWHMARETGLVREAVSGKYEVQFAELKSLGDAYTNVATSKFSVDSLNRFADDAVKNPYNDYIKTALGIRKNSDYPWWIKPNTMVDEAVSKVLNKVQAAVETARNPDELLQVNAMLEKAGYKGAHYDEGMEIFANATPDRGLLIGAVQKANSVLAAVVLRLDTLNAVNNAVSANVLLGAETKAVIRAISRGDEEAVGALAALTRIGVPGTGQSVLSPTKLIANSIKKFGRDKEAMQFYKDHGLVTTISDQYASTLDALTYTGGDVASWSSRINGVQKNLRELANTGEKWTGNRLAEEFNRFIAADVMKQMTDVAVARNLMTPKEALAYMNTFVNRTQGNYLASQRPMMFQGAVGQAIGLFQTYQFNLMQQLLRHVGEGHAKDAMTLLALQGTIHGMNGLPGFNFMNTHIIGNASGNTSHRDAYDAVYGAVGKEAGDWITYGAASNALGMMHPDLKINLYTRGDINPRHVTIVPTSIEDIPVIQASGKVFGNLLETAKKLGAGGDVANTLLQGLEHNGISRPLAGLVQTMEGLANPMDMSYSTSKRGNVIAANDILSLANLGRLAGGKPLDEAVAIDASYRFKAYGLADAKRRALLGESIKTTMIAGGNPTTEQIEDFAEKYAAAGGRQEEFNKWFGQLYKTANLSQTNKIQQSLTSPFTQSMQKIMGGRELRDFSE